MDYKSVIESKYNRQRWMELLHDIFRSKISIWSPVGEVYTNSPFAKKVLQLGTIELSDGYKIAIYEVELTESVDIERNRRGIRDMLLSSWRGCFAGAFMFCYRNNESVLRFSYVSESWAVAEDGTYNKESTDTKRFTYLLGEGHRSRTAIQQFEKLKNSSLNLKDLTKAFSVDAVSDMFFDEYKKNYENIIFYITGKRMVKVANKWEERQEGEPNPIIMNEFARFQNPEKAVRDYVKKLMGRLVFLQFLQKKGWLGVPVNEPWGNGDSEFIQHLFANTRDKDYFIDNVLEVLFKDLNSERTNDLVSLAVGSNIRVPYLNGGLFERDAADETNFPLDAEYMRKLLDFFSSYNFTIDENDPDDAEVGVDPEMLGRIFENLLEDNKDKGAFYTPKEIVTYMCRESLIAYLQTDIEDEETKEGIRQFVTTHEKNDKLPADTDQKLKDVKICDPAIGSGAFPMGLLKELFQCRTALEGIEQSKAAEIKKHIIQNNIYGVDIERGAVDIARLRFWLSLIVDEETPQALPNLDYKIVEGNSLITTFDGQYIDLEKGKGEARFRSSLINIQKEKKLLQEEQKRFFALTGYEKYKSEIAIKTHILNTIWFQLDFEKHSWQDATIEQAGLFGITESKGRKKNTAQIAEFTPERQKVLEKCEELQSLLNDKNRPLPDRANTNISFFEWSTCFPEIFDETQQYGFDIVIGNPPYGAKLSDNDKELFRILYPETQFKIDTYSLFVLHSLNILKKGGFCYYIIPNTLLDNYFEEEVRRKLLNNRVYEINDLSDKVFETAVVHSMIFGFSKKFITDNIVRVGISEKLDDINAMIPSSYFMNQPQCTFSIRTYGTNDLMDKLRNNSVRLADVIDIRQAIKSGNDKLYISNTPINNDYKPILRGKDVKKYAITPPGLYLWYGRHLACPRSRDIFEQPKILIREAGSEITACYDNDNYYIMSSLYNAILINKDYSLKYILGLLNSCLFQFMMYKLTFEKTKGAFTKAKIYHYYELPVKCCNYAKQQTIINKVDSILKIKKLNPAADISSLERDIDELVCELYELSDDEIKVIEEIKK